MGWVFGAVLILLVMGVMFMIPVVLIMEDKAMEDPEEIREICEACMWRDAGMTDPCKKCFIREALNGTHDDDEQSIIID